MEADQTIVLLHSSDLHVDDALVKRERNGLDGLRAVLATAHALAADVVLLAGDTFDNHRVSAPVLARAAALLGDARMPVILLPGNHDPALPDCLFQRAGLTDMTRLHVLGVTHAEAVVFPEHDLEIWGRPHRSFNDMLPLESPRPRSTRWQVAMAHGHYVPPAEWKAQSHRAWLISDADLRATGADYVALGHWDRAAEVGDGGVRAFYSGSPDLAGTANVIRLSTYGGVTVSRVPLRWT
jgi:DNA repair exonuclease SbcCD nuclease subunit